MGLEFSPCLTGMQLPFRHTNSFPQRAPPESVLASRRRTQKGLTFLMLKLRVLHSRRQRTLLFLELAFLLAQHYLWAAQVLRLGDFSERLSLLWTQSAFEICCIRAYTSFDVLFLSAHIVCEWEWNAFGNTAKGLLYSSLWGRYSS